MKWATDERTSSKGRTVFSINRQGMQGRDDDDQYRVVIIKWDSVAGLIKNLNALIDTYRECDGLLPPERMCILNAMRQQESVDILHDDDDGLN